MRRSAAPLLAALLATVLLLAGCSGGDPAADSAAGGGTDAEQSAGDESGGEQAPPADPTSVVPGRVVSGRVVPGASLVRTAELTVRVDDVRRAADAASRLVTQSGGVVESEERTRAGEDASAVAVLRVPPAAFVPTLTRLAELGEEVDRRLGTTDVTEQVVDLDSRLATQRASLARLQALLDRAGSIGEVVQVEAELTRRTADLESLEARLAALEGQVDRSTITLRLEDGDGAVLGDGGARGFRDGLAAGWSALVTVGRALGVAAGALLPFSPVLLLAVVGWRLRTRRATRPATPASA